MRSTRLRSTCRSQNSRTGRIRRAACRRRRRGRSWLILSRSRGTWLSVCLYERGSCFCCCGACCGVACTVMMLAVAYRIKTLASAVSRLRWVDGAIAFARLCVGCSEGEARGPRNPSQHPCLCREASPWTASRRLERRACRACRGSSFTAWHRGTTHYTRGEAASIATRPGLQRWYIALVPPRCQHQ